MALDMQHDMILLNEDWRKRGYDPLHIGIHTGFVTVGSSDFLDYTVIGRAVRHHHSFASRKETGDQRAPREARIGVKARSDAVPWAKSVKRLGNS